MIPEIFTPIPLIVFVNGKLLWFCEIILLSLVRLFMSNSENRKHLKNFRNVDWVLANCNKVQDTQANLKTTN